MTPTWPCGHPKANNVRRIGSGRTTCARCRCSIDQRYRERQNDGIDAAVARLLQIARGAGA